MIFIEKFRPLASFTAILLTTVLVFAQPRGTQSPVIYLDYASAQPILQAMSEALPTELRGQDANALAILWPQWVTRHDAEIRSRLRQGDEDTIINFLLFGTSFTRAPRATPRQIEQIMSRSNSQTAGGDASTALATILETRINDLLRALSAPGTNDRLLFARQVIVNQRNIDITTEAGRQQARIYLITSLGRVLGEQANYARAIEAARAVNPNEEVVERSRLYRTRGLSSDTSILPNFAVEETLKELQRRGLLTGSVRRVAIVGPGLDFADKQEGFDFYPQQTIQPFAVIDSLLRLRLSVLDDLQVTTFDLSPRVNDHLRQARARAARRQNYTVQLPRDTQGGWKPELARYWQSFGSMIGSPIVPAAVPQGASGLEVRAVAIRPTVVMKVTPVDVNIVLQRQERAPTEQFDLIIGTNIFSYYDTFEQSLAMANVARMLRPGGFLLSNNALLELPVTPMRSAGYSTVVYSDRQNDGDFVFWYRRLPS
jgi:SAM-dependent methyltransferase